MIQFLYLKKVKKLLGRWQNLKKWFNFKYEVIYFYNVYGPYQICKGSMSTVIGIFEDHYKRGKPLPVVKPGTQSRRFTHIDDTVGICYYAWKKNGRINSVSDFLFKNKIKGKIGTFSFKDKKVIQDLNIYKTEKNKFIKF